MAEKRRGLGRGLGALISSSPVAEETTEVPVSPPVERSTEEDAATTREAVVSRETKGAKKPVGVQAAAHPQETSPVGSNAGAQSSTTVQDSRTSVSGNGSSAPTAVPPDSQSPSTVESPTEPSKGKPAKAENGREGAMSRKPRPVDMFFTASPTSEADQGGTEAENSGAREQRRGSGARPKRAEMPDVIGAVRGREPGSAAVRNAAQQATGAGTAIPSPSEATRDSREDVSRGTLIEVPGASFAEIPVRNIHPNRKQPRSAFDEEDMAELVHSVREVGLLQPIVVRPSEEEGQFYELVMGERRWRAVQLAGLESIPAIIRETSNVDLLRDALLENLHRSQLNPLEEAAAYQQLLQEFECTQEELSERIGRSRPQISNTIRLMKLPALVQRRVAAGVLSAGHARALLALSDSGDMERIAQRIVNEGLSVRATEEIVALSDGLRRPSRETPARSTARHERLDFLANSLSDQLDTNVKITLGAKKGRVSIEFASVDDLNRIMGVISPGSAS